MEEVTIPEKCAKCGEEEYMPYECKFCGQKFCAEHRLPENHDCPGLEQHKLKMREEGKMFDQKQVKTSGSSKNKFIKYISYFKQNVAYLFLAIIVVNFLIQQTIQATNPSLAVKIFYLTDNFLARPWTLITSIFSHYGTFHLLMNGIVLFFFGPMLERLIGSKRFVYLFMGAGILAGLVQVLALGLIFLPNTPFSVLGASGAIAAVLGAQTVFTPRLKIFLMFIPMELWIATLFFVLISIAFIGSPGQANLAHLIGIVTGLLYGYYLKDKIKISRFESQNLFGGGRGGGPF